jgi:hypothetical protein
MGFFTTSGLVDTYTQEAYTDATLTVLGAVFLATEEKMFP